MHVDEARRYSRSAGLSWCESVNGTPGRCSASSSPTRSSCAGFDDRPEQADADRLDLELAQPRGDRRSPPASSSGATTSPSAPIRSGTSNVSARGTYGSRVGAREVERVGAAALAEQQDVGVARRWSGTRCARCCR